MSGVRRARRIASDEAQRRRRGEREHQPSVGALPRPARARGFDPAQYNFESAAADVLNLMWLRHISHANLVAFGDLGIEAFAILRAAPGAVRTLTLENPSPPDVTRFTDPTSDLAGAFRRLDVQCRADHVCWAAYPNLESVYSASATLRIRPSRNWSRRPIPKIRTPRRLNCSSTAPESRTRSPTATPKLGARPRRFATAIMSASPELLASVVVENDRLTDDAPWGAQASYYCSYLVHTEDEALQALAAKTLPEFVSPTTCLVRVVQGMARSRPLRDARQATSSATCHYWRSAANITPEGNPGWLPKIERGLSAMQSAAFPTLGAVSWETAAVPERDPQQIRAQSDRGPRHGRVREAVAADCLRDADKLSPISLRRRGRRGVGPRPFTSLRKASTFTTVV